MRLDSSCWEIPALWLNSFEYVNLGLSWARVSVFTILVNKMGQSGSCSRFVRKINSFIDLFVRFLKNSSREMVFPVNTSYSFFFFFFFFFFFATVRAFNNIQLPIPKNINENSFNEMLHHFSCLCVQKLFMHASKETLNSPSSRVDADLEWRCCRCCRC